MQALTMCCGQPTVRLPYYMTSEADILSLCAVAAGPVVRTPIHSQ